MRIPYGSGPSQFGELTRPPGTAESPIVVIVHGGFWRAAYDCGLGRPLAGDLAGRGIAAWNLEYRRVGDDAATGGGGGWPATFEDVEAGLQRLAGLGPGLDLTRVVALGHSAGGQLAAWLGSRRGPVRVTGVVSQAGVLDLESASAVGLGRGAADEFLGGSPDDHPERFAAASPLRLLPLGVPIWCVHGDADPDVPYEQSAAFVDAARRAGDEAHLVTVEGGDHYSPITPCGPGWAACVRAIETLIARA